MATLYQRVLGYLAQRPDVVVVDKALASGGFEYNGFERRQFGEIVVDITERKVVERRFGGLLKREKLVPVTSIDELALDLSKHLGLGCWSDLVKEGVREIVESPADMIFDGVIISTEPVYLAAIRAGKKTA